MRTNQVSILSVIVQIEAELTIKAANSHADKFCSTVFQQTDRDLRRRNTPPGYGQTKPKEHKPVKKPEPKPVGHKKPEPYKPTKKEPKPAPHKPAPYKPQPPKHPHKKPEPPHKPAPYKPQPPKKPHKVRTAGLLTKGSQN